MTADAAAHYWNPGQLGWLARPELYLGAGVVFGRVGIQRERLGAYQFADGLAFAEPVDPELLDPTRTGTTRAVSATPIAPLGSVFAAFPVGERVVLGVGAAVPYAAAVDYPDDGPQRFQAQRAFVAAAHIGPSIAVELHRTVSLGAGVSYVLSVLDFARVQDFAALDDLGAALASEAIGQPNAFGPNAPTAVRELDVLARPVSVSRAIGHGVTFNVGLALRPVERLDLGLTYEHGSQVDANGTFAADLDDDFFTQDLAAQGLQYVPLVEGDANVKFRLPKRASLGVGWTFGPKVRLDGYVQYAVYSETDALRVTLQSPDLAQPEVGLGDTTRLVIDRDWQDSVIVSVNGRFRPLERLLVSATLGYQSPASPDSTIDALSPDGQRIVGGVGVGWDFGPRFTLYGDASVQGIVPREVTTSAFDLANGRYDLVLANVGITGRFRFGTPGPGDPAPRPRRGGSKRPAPPEDDDAGLTTAPQGPGRAPPPPPAPPVRSSPPPPPPPAALATLGRGDVARR